MATNRKKKADRSNFQTIKMSEVKIGKYNRKGELQEITRKILVSGPFDLVVDKHYETGKKPKFDKLGNRRREEIVLKAGEKEFSRKTVQRVIKHGTGFNHNPFTF